MNIEKAIYAKAQRAFMAPQGMFENFSELTETLLFLSICAYNEEPEGHFARRLLHVKALKELAISDLTALPAVKRLHVYIDVSALRFLDLLVDKYPVVFPHRKEALELIYYYALLYNAKEKAHFFSRLEEVRRLHP